MATENDFQDWGGRNEKWFQSTVGYHFVTPNGQIFEWDGSSSDSLTGVLVGELTNSYYEDPTLIYDAQFPGGDAISVASGESVMHSFGNAEVTDDDDDDGGDIDVEYGAGNISARVSHGDLVITGDGAGNGVSVFLDDNRIIVVGLGDTTVNGSNATFVAFQSTSIPDDLRIDLKGGDNVLLLQDFYVHDDLRISSDAGADYLLLDNVNIGNDLRIDSHAGDDIVGLNEVRVTDRTTIHGHDGQDVIAAIASVFQDKTRIRTHDGADMVYIESSRVNDDLDVDLDDGNDRLAILNSRISDEAELDGDSDFDALLFGSRGSSAGDLDQEDFESGAINDLDAQIDLVLERLAVRGIEFSFESN